MKNYGILSLKILLWILGIILFLVLLIFVLIQVPAVQNVARSKAVSFLEKKIGTRVEVNKLSLDLPKLIVLEDVYFEDQQGDTLLAGDTLKVDISLFKLLKNTVEINEVDLRGITANISRTPDSVFNFDYIVNAFVAEQTQPQPVDTSAAPMKFSVDKINLDRIRINYKDAPTANDIAVSLGHFDTRIKTFDLEKNKYEIPTFKLSNLTAIIKQGKPAAVADSESKDLAEVAAAPMPELQLGSGDIDRVNVIYRNAVSALDADVRIGRLNFETNQLDLNKQLISLQKLSLDQSAFRITLGKKEAAKVVKEEAQDEAEAVAAVWNFSAGEISLNHNDIRFDDQNLPRQKAGMDYGHLNFKDLSLQASDLVYREDTISGRINSASTREQSGFELQKLRANFFYGKNEAYAKDLYLQTGQTLIKNEIGVRYSSIESLSSNPGDLRIDANLDGSRLGLRDVLVFVPDLASTEPFKSHSFEILNINGRVQGRLANLSIPNLQVSGFGNTSLSASGTVRGLPDMERMFADIKIKRLSTTSRDLHALTPPGTIPSNIRIPDALQVSGSFSGGINRFNTDLQLNSTDGSAKVQAFVSNGTTMAYKGEARVYRLNLGRILRQESTMGRVSLAAAFNGSGTSVETLNGTLSGKLIQAEYNGYNYRNLVLKGRAKNGQVSAVASMADPNLSFDLNAKANLSKPYPAVQMNLSLDSVNLQKLHFSSEDMRFRGQLTADLETADPDYLNGTVLLNDAVMVRAGERVQIDSVTLVSRSTADSNSIRVQSPVLNARMWGKYKLSSIGPALQSVINRYYTTGSSNGSVKRYDDRMQFEARISNGPMLSGFDPNLKELATVSLSGSFDGNTGTLKARGSAPKIVYGSYQVDQLNFDLGTENNALGYRITLNRLGSSQFQLLNTSLNGDVRDNNLNARLEVKDQDNKRQYFIEGALKALGNNYEFSLQPNGLVLNYDPWNVSQGNVLRFGQDGIMAQNFVLSNAAQQLSLNTTPPGLNNPLTVTFSNFKIETLTEIARKDSMLVGGTINGNAVLRNLQSSAVFTSDLNVSDFNFQGDTVGNIALQVNNERENTLAARMSITGQGNDVNLNGYYYINNRNFDLDLDVANLNLKSVQGFTMGSMKDASGSIRGKLGITGTADNPNVLGELGFYDAAFRIGMFNSLYRIDDEQVSFNEDGLRFNNFSITDSAGNDLNLDGMLYTSNFIDYRFNLDLSSDNFQVLNSTAKDNELYFGQLYLDSRIRIRGDMDAPVIDGNIKILKDTKFTVVLPQTDPGIVEREGVVEFVDLDNPENTRALTSNLDTTANSGLLGMDISTNIEVDKEAEFNIIVDQGNGDFLRIKGQAVLNAGIDPSGKINLTGNYELKQGSYELSFNFIRRRFDIREGSTITWNGDPLSANINVTAVYVAETAPLDLVANQLGGASVAEVNMYKQQLPFELLLNLNGELMKPVISFDIDLPERNYNVASTVIQTVNTRLDQLKTEPSELNKQAFALVLLNRFVSDNVFSSSAGGTSAESLARQSVSKLLNEQLNELAGDLIGGVDLNFNLESTDDYTTGQLKNRTDLNVTASKRLLNDRINVSVGSNFELEGPNQPRRQTNNLAGDIAVDYQLSKDGRYMLRAYRKNQYQVAVEGQVVETGLGFILNVDYNKFREILRRKTEEEKERRAEEKAEKKLAADD